MTTQVNDNLILIAGESATGKSASLMNLQDPEGVIYLNCEAGKKLPFRSKFQQFVITEPYQVHECFEAKAAGKITGHTVVVDTLTYLLDMYESQYIFNSANGQQAWNNFQQYFKKLMQEYVAAADCNVIFLAHTKEDYDQAKMEMKSSVPVKGALKNNGIESYFSTVISTKKMTLKKLEDFKNGLLVITPQDEAVGYKHVFQTQITKETVGERIRGPMGMWSQQETYVDNDVQKVLNHMHAYYA